jgi:hypothetical protein
MAANGAIRLRLAGEAIADLRLVDHNYSAGEDHLSSSTTLVRDEAAAVRDWYAAVGDALDPHRRGSGPPEPSADIRVEDVLDVLRTDLIVNVAAGGDTAHAKSVLWASLYLQDMRTHESRLMPHVEAML